MPEDTLTFQQAISFLYERFRATQLLWNLYLAASLGILGFLTAAKIAVTTKRSRVIATIAFLIFAASNWYAIEDLRRQREALVAVAEERLQGPP